MSDENDDSKLPEDVLEPRPKKQYKRRTKIPKGMLQLQEAVPIPKSPTYGSLALPANVKPWLEKVLGEQNLSAEKLANLYNESFPSNPAISPKIAAKFISEHNKFLAAVDRFVRLEDARANHLYNSQTRRYMGVTLMKKFSEAAEKDDPKYLKIAETIIKLQKLQNDISITAPPPQEDAKDSTNILLDVQARLEKLSERYTKKEEPAKRIMVGTPIDADLVVVGEIVTPKSDDSDDA